MLQLFVNGLFGMVFGHLWDFFHPKDFANGFSQLFQLYFHITQGHISCWITHVFGVARIIAMTKLVNGVCPIVLGETLHQFTNHILCFQFMLNPTHFSSHPFGVTTKGGCEQIIYVVKCTLDFHPNWFVIQLHVVNAFNLVFKGVIFQKLRVTCGDIIQFIPFVHAFHAQVSPISQSS
jgi:hypothetical protein